MVLYFCECVQSIILKLLVCIYSLHMRVDLETLSSLALFVKLLLDLVFGPDAF